MKSFKPHISPLDIDLAAYRFSLPEELIAQEPPEIRGESRLMIHDRRGGKAIPVKFADLLEYLPKGVVVVNNSRVVPARVYGKRESGGKVEMLLTTPLPHIIPEKIEEIEKTPRTGKILETGNSLEIKKEQTREKNGKKTAVVECLLKSSKKVRENETIFFEEDFSATVLERKEYGKCTVKLIWTGSLPKRLHSTGVMPLPPYIKRPQSAEDGLRYQTVYANENKAGSVAAPTAGLHFTQKMKTRLQEEGFTWAEVTLYVGYGTFSPVRCENILDHEMHHEYCEITEENARIIHQAKESGIPVTAVGTTAARTLEGVAEKFGKTVAYAGWTNIFLYPGKPVRVVDHLLTNFHLPESTLLMLVSALTGREAALKTYRKAVEERFRFFSYGDAMLIL